ncbi:MAG: hypothetical protein DRQ44_07445, partial [Gammaproteobacteria bacterium]
QVLLRHLNKACVHSGDLRGPGLFIFIKTFTAVPLINILMFTNSDMADINRDSTHRDMNR